MSQDLSYIKREIDKCEEADSAFDLRIGDLVRYITLKGGVEYFYDGGTYVGMGDNKVILNCNNQNKSIIISYFNKEGETLYKSRFFIVQKGEVSVRDHTEYEKIIKNQQRIIEVLVQKNKRLEEGN